MVCQSSLGLSFICALPLMMCMISVQDVLKVYSPADMTPTLAGCVGLVGKADGFNRACKIFVYLEHEFNSSFKKICSIALWHAGVTI